MRALVGLLAVTCMTAGCAATAETPEAQESAASEINASVVFKRAEQLPREWPISFPAVPPNQPTSLNIAFAEATTINASPPTPEYAGDYDSYIAEVEKRDRMPPGKLGECLARAVGGYEVVIPTGTALKITRFQVIRRTETEQYLSLSLLSGAAPRPYFSLSVDCELPDGVPTFEELERMLGPDVKLGPLR